MTQPRPTLRCSVGITAYNEEDNIGPLLDAMLDQHLHDVEITRDHRRGQRLHRQHRAHYPLRIRRAIRACKLIEQPERRGKTSAINLFLQAASEDILVLESGDTLPHENAVENLVRVF